MLSHERQPGNVLALYATQLEAEGIAVQRFPLYRNERYRPHSVDVVLLTYVARGYGWHKMGDHEFPQSPGSLGITHYGQEHDLLTDPDGMTVYNIYLDLNRHSLPSLPTSLNDVLPEILPLRPTFQNLRNRRVHIQFDDHEPITALVERMHRESTEGEAGAGEVLRSCLRILLIECCRQYSRGRTGDFADGFADGAPATAWLERVLRRIDLEFREPVTLADLAATAGVNPSYLSRAFKRHVGKALFEYLAERRIQAAMSQLRGSDTKVLRVALECGFSDLVWFNRRFKALVGCTPTQYRDRFSC